VTSTARYILFTTVLHLPDSVASAIDDLNGRRQTSNDYDYAMLIPYPPSNQFDRGDCSRQFRAKRSPA
jgi:hypothetical protein